MYYDVPNRFRVRLGRPNGVVWDDQGETLSAIEDAIQKRFKKAGIDVFGLFDKLEKTIKKALEKRDREIVIDTMRGNYPILYRNGARFVVQTYDEPLDMAVTVTLEDFLHDYIAAYEEEDQAEEVAALRRVLDRAARKANKK